MALRSRSNGRVHHVDVVHAGEDRDTALRKLERAIDEALQGNYRGLKVIHGRGSTKGIALLKPQIVAAMKRAAARYGGKVVERRFCGWNEGTGLPSLRRAG
jgi:DNA-nicking Smr family endonuclease